MDSSPLLPRHWCPVGVIVGTECGAGWQAGSMCAPETFSCWQQGVTESSWLAGEQGDIESGSAKTFTRAGRKRGAVGPLFKGNRLVAVKRKTEKSPWSPS